MDRKIVGLIPARAGSKRVKSKNVRPVAGHPMIAYTIAAAIESGIFADIVVSTDSEEIAAIARYYGANVPFLRPKELAQDLSPDVEWVEYTLTRLAATQGEYPYFSILRPTSPLRQAQTIRRAWDQFRNSAGADSLRAVELCQQHPCKMWVVNEDRIVPLIPVGPANPPWHSSPYQSLPLVYVQNASLEMARSEVVYKSRTIAGNVIIPFFTEGNEGFDVNNESDLVLLDHLIASGKGRLPNIEKESYSF